MILMALTGAMVGLKTRVNVASQMHCPHLAAVLASSAAAPLAVGGELCRMLPE